jgi:hypothetical protein
VVLSFQLKEKVLVVIFVVENGKTYKIQKMQKTKKHLPRQSLDGLMIDMLSS